MRETWYVIEDGSVAHPRDVKQDADGILRHKDGRAVQMRGDVPRSRSVDVAAELAQADAAAAKAKADAEAAAAAAASKARDMKPEQNKPGYKTRSLKPSSLDDDEDQKIL